MGKVSQGLKAENYEVISSLNKNKNHQPKPIHLVISKLLVLVTEFIENNA